MSIFPLNRIYILRLYYPLSTQKMNTNILKTALHVLSNAVKENTILAVLPARVHEWFHSDSRGLDAYFLHESTLCSAGDIQK